MWIKNSDNNQWYQTIDSLQKDNFDSLKQEIQSVILYSKCLSGSTYIPINNLSSIYDMSHSENYNWYIGGSSYSTSTMPEYPKSINISTQDEYYNKFIYEYGLTLKNKFTPSKLISDSLKNYIEVDATSTISISINEYQPGLIIDGVTLKDGNLVLIKDQVSYITLSNEVDPDSYFTHSYYVSKNDISSTEYYYYNSDNGVYQYKNGTLTRTSHLNNYEDSYRFSVVSKFGLVNIGLQYHLNRLKSGYFPVYSQGDSMEFVTKKNWVLRHRVDYHNIYEISYYDIHKFGTQSYTDNNYNYEIPERIISVGDFGMINLYQSGVSNIINNKYKYTLTSISETDKYYYICGYQGTLLKVSKLNFEIESIDIGELNNLKSISFFDKKRGIVVGKFNSIYFTDDSGITWKSISNPEFNEYSYNKVIFNAYDKAYIGGDSGVFIEMTYNNNKWTLYKRAILKYLDINEPTEEYLLVDDINDMSIISYTSSNPWGLTYSIQDNKDVLFLCTNGGNVLFYDINNFISNYDFVYLSFTSSTEDITSISAISGSSSIFISSDKVYSIDINNFTNINSVSNQITSTFSSIIIGDVYVNKMNSYDNLYLCGNNSTLYKYDFTSLTFSSIDSEFNFKYNSKLLFLDYDIGSKLNFFDTSYNYRLPDSITFSISDISDFIHIDNKPNEVNWINYYKDSEKTFEYYSSFDDDNKVMFSTTFSYSGSTYLSFTSSNINITYEGISSLAPNIGITGSSRYISGTQSIIGSIYPENVFIYKYLLVLRTNILYPSDIGDVLLFQSDIVSTTMIINKKFVIGFTLYIYCYHNFNDSIINDIKSYSGQISISNLNKFSTIGNTTPSFLSDNSDIWNYDGSSVNNNFSYTNITSGDLLVNFNLHPISHGYKLIVDNGDYIISAKYNNKTAYYNMQSLITTSTGTFSMDYKETFLIFGYKPTYNLYDYLSNIDSSFNNKYFYSMPLYSSIPANNGSGFTSSLIYIDTNYDTNKLLFGENLQFEWESLWINTFVDVNLYGSSTYSNNKMLIIKKYYDSTINGYYIEFHKKLNFNYGDNISSVDILSRNSIIDISDDLQVLNNIQKSSNDKQIQYGITFTNMDNELNFKFNTDSYCKILMSDRDIRNILSGIVYTDSKNEISLNIINLEKDINNQIIHTDRYPIGPVDYLLITTTQSHGLTANDGISVTFDGDGSNVYNQKYFGYQIVKGVIDEYSFYTDKIFGVDIAGYDIGNINFIKNDPFFNYIPYDIMELGVDKNTKVSVQVNPENVYLSGYTYSLINIDFTKYRYQLVDGLSVDQLSNQYPWVLQADISNAIIGKNDSGVVWYSGDWKCGIWYDGTWNSGRWISGDWYSGTFNSYNVRYQFPSLSVSKNFISSTHSTWNGGRWYSGTWNGGTWNDGRWYDGIWNGGIWNNGIWNNGTWNGGNFNGGIWVLGIWNSGTFSCDNKPSYWINGSWYGGDFENGMWYNGNFSEKDGRVSRFGTKSFNTRTSIWQAGKFSGGEFHSYLNLDMYGNTTSSQYNKYSIWNTGIWSGGNFYGGVAYSIDFNSGVWYGGVIEEIQIIGINILQGQLTTFTLNGKFYFNVNDEIWVVNDGNPTPYSSIGTNESPGNYKVLLTDVVNDITIITIDKDLTSLSGTMSLSNIETGLRCTTIFKNSIWKRGIWTNGIFDETSIFEGGIWYGGVFKGQWGK